MRVRQRRPGRGVGDRFSLRLNRKRKKSLDANERDGSILSPVTWQVSPSGFQMITCRPLFAFYGQGSQILRGQSAGLQEVIQT